MEAALLLSYCGGDVSLPRWATVRGRRGRGGATPMAVGLYFVLGFMTKFVAALFLPMVLGLVVAACSPTCGARCCGTGGCGRRGRASPLAPDRAVVRLCARSLRRALLGDDLRRARLTRFTAFLDPGARAPWYLLLRDDVRAASAIRSQWLVAAGLVVLVVQTVRRRWLEGAWSCCGRAAARRSSRSARRSCITTPIRSCRRSRWRPAIWSPLLVMLVARCAAQRECLQWTHDVRGARMPVARRASRPSGRRAADACHRPCRRGRRQRSA